jgi:hypothetical protein
MTVQIASYSIEIKGEANEQLAVFTFRDVTANELQTVLASFRGILGEMGSTVVVNVVPRRSDRRRTAL